MGDYPGQLFVLSSPSGGGKTTVIKALKARQLDLQYSVSATTRPSRKKEKDGVDYHFYDEETFRRIVASNGFVEWAEVHGNCYGTLWSEVESHLKAGRYMLLDTDVQGGMNLKKALPRTVLIFLLPPSMDVLKQRLIARDTEKPEDLEIRLGVATKEIAIAESYDFQVINDRLSEAVEEIVSIINKYITNRENER